jgi:DNA-binding Xre family transcriptional regulator
MARTKKPTNEPVSTQEGQLTPPVIIVCRLKEIMDERQLTGKRLSQMTGVSEDKITNLRLQRWQNVSRRVLERLAAALNVGVHHLFVTQPADVWFPIRRHQKVTVHLGSTSSRVLEGRREPIDTSGAEDAIDRQFIGVWDHRAFAHVYNHLAKTSVGSVHYEFEEHEIGEARAPSDVYWKRSNHIVIGSPIVNPSAEHAVSFATKIPARTPARASEFPFNFRWQVTRETVSSFGARSDASPLGITATQSQEVVAERTVVAQGSGSDCGLIMTYRFSPPEKERRLGDENDDYIVIVIMGHSGCGTLASAQLLCREGEAKALYPVERERAAFGVCTATYSREYSHLAHDNRIITSFALVGGK